MKVLKKIGIWFVCILVVSGIIVAVGGVERMGAIPAVLLEIAAFALARRLCKAVDGKHAEEPEEPEAAVTAHTGADSTRAPDFSSTTYTYGSAPERKSEAESEPEPELGLRPQPSAKPRPARSKAVIILSVLCAILLFVSVFLFCLWNDTRHGPFVCAESPSESSAFRNSETSASELLQQKSTRIT